VEKSGKELDEFVRQLGFVQHDDQAKAEQIKLFIDEHQLVHKTFGNLCEVENLGWFGHRMENIRHRRLCGSV